MTDSIEEGHEETHRGGFGEFAGEATGLIDRSFREQIVLVGVQFPGSSVDQIDANLDELAQLGVGTHALERGGELALVLQHHRRQRGDLQRLSQLRQLIRPVCRPQDEHHH